MKLKLLTLVICILTCGAELLAQRTVSGTVQDNSGAPLIGVNVVEKGTTRGTVSDINGNFSINVSGEEAILVFSYTGYLTQEIPVGAQNVFDVTMEENVEVLDEVVVSALGFREEKDELGYASSSVSSEKVTNSGEATLLNALSGKSSGVRISRNSGDPGAGSYIQIRGLSTITRDAQPLIVVDGIPISNDVRGNSSSGGVSQESRLNDINPNDIESITVLKGASAAALWGTRALGGVIVITTKGGSYNQKLKVSVRSSYSVDQINRKYPLQTTFGQGTRGRYNQRARDSWGDKIADRSGGADVVDENGQFFVDQNGNTWYRILEKNSREIFDDANFDLIFQNGGYWENDVSVSAGNERSNIFFSLSNLDQEGIIRNNSDYNRTTVRTNAEHRLTDDIVLNANLNYSRTSSNRIQKGSNSSGLYLGLLRTPPDFDNSGYRGDFFARPGAAPVSNRHRSYREPIGADGTPTYNNPSWTINEQENKASVDRFIGKFELTATPTSWLSLIGRVGLDHYSEQRDEFFTPGSASGAFLTGLFGSELATNTIFNMDYIAKAGKSFGRNFSGNLLVGFNYNDRKRTVDGSEIINFIQFTDVASGVRDIDNATPENRTVNSTFGQERTAAVYSSASFSAYDMFFLNGTLRAESASTFGENVDNTFLFPSASLAWQFSNLGAFANSPLSFGKFRVSYGEVGVQPARYRNTNVFVSPTYADEYGGDLDLGLYGNGAFVPSVVLGNNNLRPERKKEFEIGADLRFFKDRLALSGTYFFNRTEDVLLDFPVANTRGFDEIYANGAEIENRGVELDLGYNVINTKNFDWNLELIYTSVRNEVTDLGGVASINLGGLAAVNSRAVEGQPIGVLWGSRILRDANGNIIFDDNGFPEQDELEGVIGDPNPDWQGSLISGFRYKNFKLTALFETFQGADIYAGTKSVLLNLGRWASTANEMTAPQDLREFNGNVIPAGTVFRGSMQDFGAGPVALTESWYTGDGGFFSNGNDEIYIEDGSWTRLRELNLSYRLSNDWLKKRTGLSSVEFIATGRNLLLWTPFEGNDPDTSISGVSAARGVEYFNNPGTQSYVFTLLLNL